MVVGNVLSPNNTSGGGSSIQLSDVIISGSLYSRTSYSANDLVCQTIDFVPDKILVAFTIGGGTYIVICEPSKSTTQYIRIKDANEATLYVGTASINNAFTLRLIDVQQNSTTLVFSFYTQYSGSSYPYTYRFIAYNE